MNDQIIQKYCGNVEERIRCCRTRQVAEILKALLCRELHSACSDAATSDYLKQKVDLIIHDAFTPDGKNRLFLRKDE
jgi:hypothetical protein